MRIIGCDLHTAKQTIAMLDRDTGEVVEHTLNHDGEAVRAFYAAIPKPAVVGIEATGSMGWFVRLMEELGLTCRVGHPAAIRTAEPRRQEHDRRDAQLLLLCYWRIGFRRSGCRRQNNGICERCSSTRTS